jgi:hypothetical protein
MDETHSISSRKWKEWTGFTLEILSIRIARFLVRVQVEELLKIKVTPGQKASGNFYYTGSIVPAAFLGVI